MKERGTYAAQWGLLRSYILNLGTALPVLSDSVNFDDSHC